VGLGKAGNYFRIDNHSIIHNQIRNQIADQFAAIENRKGALERNAMASAF
jgi:hypothetical protein